MTTIRQFHTYTCETNYYDRATGLIGISYVQHSANLWIRDSFKKFQYDGFKVINITPFSYEGHVGVMIDFEINAGIFPDLSNDDTASESNG